MRGTPFGGVPRVSFCAAGDLAPGARPLGDSRGVCARSGIVPGLRAHFVSTAFRGWITDGCLIRSAAESAREGMTAEGFHGQELRRATGVQEPAKPLWSPAVAAAGSPTQPRSHRDPGLRRGRFSTHPPSRRGPRPRRSRPPHNRPNGRAAATADSERNRRAIATPVPTAAGTQHNQPSHRDPGPHRGRSSTRPPSRRDPCPTAAGSQRNPPTRRALCRATAAISQTVTPLAHRSRSQPSRRGL